MNKPVVIAGGTAMVLLALAYFVLLPMMKGKPAAKATGDEEPAAAASRTKSKQAPEPGLIYPIPERVLNLTGPAGVPHYARIELALEFAPPKGARAAKPQTGSEGKATAEPSLDPALDPVAARKAPIDDLVNRIISAKTFEQMTSAAGKAALKQEILDAVAAAVPAPEIIGVYIVRLVVQ